MTSRSARDSGSGAWAASWTGPSRSRRMVAAVEPGQQVAHPRREHDHRRVAVAPAEHQAEADSDDAGD